MTPRNLADFQGECRPSGSQLNFKVCPVCGSEDWKLYVSPENGMWFCQAGRHQRGGRVEVGGAAHVRTEQAAILRMLSPILEVTKQAAEAALPAWSAPSSAARRYLNKRGITDEAITTWGLVEWDDEFRVLIPYFDGEGRLAYYSGRRYSDNLGSGPKYKNMPGRHPLYIPDREGGGKVVLVEGPFDAMAVRLHTPYHAIALGGKSLPTYLRKPLRDEILSAILLEEGGKLIIALDGDAFGDAIKLKERLLPMRGVPVHFALFEPGEDPANVSPDRLRKVLRG